MRNECYLQDKLSNLKLVMLIRCAILHCKKTINKHMHVNITHWHSENFYKRGAIISTFFSNVYFSGRTKLKLIKNSVRSREGWGDMSPPAKIVVPQQTKKICPGGNASFNLIYMPPPSDKYLEKLNVFMVA